MTGPQLPAPLVPAEVDLRDFQGMWIDTDRLLKSDTWMLGTGDEKASAMTLWLESWHQVPAASLPNNDRILARISQSERWAKSKAHALRGWVECSDGRLYHPVVAEKALEAWIEKLSAAINGAEGNAKRWQVSVSTATLRAQLRTAADLLRKINAGSRALKKKAVVVILSGSPPESPPESPPDGPNASPPDRLTIARDQTRPDQTGLDIPPTGGGGSAHRAAPPTAPPDFDGQNAEALNGKCVVPLAAAWDLPEAWGVDAEALGWQPAEVLREAEKFRQYWVAGRGAGQRRSVRGWRQSWSHWLEKAAKDRR